MKSKLNIVKAVQSVSVLLVFLLYGCGSNAGKQLKVPAAMMQQAKNAFAELNECIDNDGGKMWGHTLASPLMFVDRDTRIIIANEQDSKGVLKQKDGLFVGILPDEINIANTAFDWNGKRWTMIFFPLPDTKAGRLRLLVHESFHQIQPETGFDNLAEMSNNHLDTKEGRILLKLEMEALKKALMADDPAVPLKDALKFRHYRRQQFPGTDVSENSLEIIEGMAEYTGIMLSGLNDDEIRNLLYSQIDEMLKQPTYVRSFAYYEFPVYGYFMGKYDAEWNRRTNKETDLTALMSQLSGITVTDLTEKEIMETGKGYSIDTVIAVEEERELKRLEKIRKYRKLFLRDSVLVLSLENMQIGFNPSNLMPLDSAGTVYPNIRVTDNWGILEVDSCGALLSGDWRKVTVSYPVNITDTLVTGRGWKLRLNDDWRLSASGDGYVVEK